MSISAELTTCMLLTPKLVALDDRALAKYMATHSWPLSIRKITIRAILKRDDTHASLRIWTHT